MNAPKQRKRSPEAVQYSGIVTVVLVRFVTVFLMKNKEQIPGSTFEQETNHTYHAKHILDDINAVDRSTTTLTGRNQHTTQQKQPTRNERVVPI